MSVVSRMLAFVLSAWLFIACGNGLKDGRSISSDEKAYIGSLGLLESSETIILFDSQSDLRTSGNFVTDQRIAAYWIDKDPARNSIGFARYADIDTLRTTDLSHAWTYASYLEVIRKDGTRFKVYVDGDSSEVWTFFNVAMSEWTGRAGR